MSRRQHNANRKYSFKDGNLAAARQGDTQDSVGEGNEGKTEEFEMKGALVGDDETDEDDGNMQQEQEENEDHFQDPTSICEYSVASPFSRRVTLHTLSQPSFYQCQSLTQYPLRGSQSM